MNIVVKKLTDVDLLRKANSFTTGRDSKMSLATSYKVRHTNIRTQLFLVECYDIPQFVSYHLRTHFTIYPMPPFEYGWMGSKRVDRGGLDFNEVCRSLAFGIRTEFIGKEDKPVKELSEEYCKWADAVEALPSKFDRLAPTRFGFFISAEGLMKMSETRLCIGAVAKETREVVEAICKKVKNVDPDLYPYLVKPCVLYGFCKEKSCGYNKTIGYKKERENYLKLFEQ